MQYLAQQASALIGFKRMALKSNLKLEESSHFSVSNLVRQIKLCFKYYNLKDIPDPAPGAGLLSLAFKDKEKYAARSTGLSGYLSWTWYNQSG